VNRTLDILVSNLRREFLEDYEREKKATFNVEMNEGEEEDVYEVGRASENFNQVLINLTQIKNYNAIDPTKDTAEIEKCMINFLKLGGHCTFVFGKDVEAFPRLNHIYKCHNE
jgi:hypothetical protein